MRRGVEDHMARWLGSAPAVRAEVAEEREADLQARIRARLWSGGGEG